MANLDDLYRGYVSLSGKKADMGYKDVPDADLLSLDEAKKCRGYGGVLRENVVLVDVDDMAQAELLRKILNAYRIRARVTKTTRGMHFTMFCNVPLQNKSHLESFIGITCDYKYGANASYEALKIDGQEREVLEDPKTISMMPVWLYPISDKPLSKRQDYTSIVGMGEGEGRNDALFRRCFSNLTRSKGGKIQTPFNPGIHLTKKDFDDAFEIINLYIFAEPLDDSEMATLTSQERFEERLGFSQKVEKKGRSSEVEAAVEDLIEKAKIRQFGRLLYRLEAGRRYRIVTEAFLNHELLHKRKVPPEKSQSANKLIRAVLDEDRENDPVPSWFAGLRNGVIDWRSGEVIPYSDATVCFRFFDVDYREDIDTSFVESVLLDWCQGNRTQYRMLLEMAGACLYRDKPIKKWWVIEGAADTGKSTFIELLRNVIGKEMIGSVPVQSIKDSNAVAELLDKSVNIVDDGSSRYTRDLSALRQIIQGTPMQLKILYQDRFTATLEARMIFVFNEIPRFRDDNGATAKKMIVLRFDRVYSDEEKDIHLLEKLTTEENRSAFIKLAIDAMREVMDRNLVFTISEESKRITEELVERGDQFKSYLDDLRNEDGSIEWDELLDGKSVKTVYEDFKRWAYDNGYRNLILQKTFTERMLNACRDAGKEARKGGKSRGFYLVGG